MLSIKPSRRIASRYQGPQSRPSTNRIIRSILLTVAVIVGISGCTAPAPGFDTPHQAPITSPNDTRQYRHLTLENGLAVLVVSDPGADKAAASLDVHVGSGSDPKGREGLAHFLEHMLFLGTEKYPQAGEYQSFISQHGGRHNAYTSYDHTNYFFDIEAQYLEPILDRFAQFFTAPLLDSQYVEREKNAVHSEYQSKLKLDSRRQFDVLKAFTNPDHPFSQFSVGSLETLADRIDDSAGSVDKSIEEDLWAFYRQHYSASNMRLVVLGTESLDELAQLAIDKFSAVPNNSATAQSTDLPLFAPGTLPSRIDIEPVKDIKRLSLTFPIPDVAPHYRSKPTHYIAGLLGHEGNGSLLALLKQRGWAEALSTGLGFGGKNFATFSVSISLTEAGLEHVNEIVGLLFANVALIERQGIQDWLYREQHQLNEIGFRFQEKATSINYVSDLAHRMHYYPLPQLLRAPIAMDEFDAELIRRYLGYLNPQNMLMTVMAKGLDTDRKSPWYDTPYAVTALSAESTQAWQAGSNAAKLALPRPNPFIPSDLKVKTVAETDNTVKGEGTEKKGAVKGTQKIPRLLIDQPGLELWHQLDTRFNTPRADFYFAIRSPLTNASAKDAAMTRLLVRIINEQLGEFTYPAYLAGLDYQLYPHLRGISVRISGFHDKQQVLLSEIVRLIKQPAISEEKFRQHRQELLRSLRNKRQNRPFNQAMDKVSNLLLAPSWSNEELVSGLETVETNDLKAFSSAFLQRIELVALANGNLSENEAKLMAELLNRQFVQGAKIQTTAHADVIKLNTDNPGIYTFGVEHPDSALIAYFQGNSQDIATRALFSLANQIVSAPFYQQLRTEKQLGYLVFSTPFTLLDTPSLTFIVQSPSADPVALERHITGFVAEFEQTLANMTEAEFSRHQQALISKIMEQETRLSQRSGRLWREIDRENFSFNTREEIAAAVAALTLAQVRTAYASHFASNGEQRRLMVIAANGQSATTEDLSFDGYRAVEEIKSWQRDGIVF